MNFSEGNNEEPNFPILEKKFYTIRKGELEVNILIAVLVILAIIIALIWIIKAVR